MDINYKGTHFHGWQIQPNGKTVQAEIERALSIILKNETAITGSGRTDAGVHATQQIAHFESSILIEPNDLIYKLNSFLPKDIGINEIKEVSDKAHARFDAAKRTYHYHIHQNKNPFKYETSYYFNHTLDSSLILEACEIIKSWEHFECFSKVHTEVNNFNCKIFGVYWLPKESNFLFVVEANRFLRGMIRAMVGTLLDVGTGKTSVGDLKEILESEDRRKAGRAVPAHGLFLESVMYPQTIYS